MSALLPESPAHDWSVISRTRYLASSFLLEEREFICVRKFRGLGYVGVVGRRSVVVGGVCRALRGSEVIPEFPLLHQGQGGANPGGITGPKRTYSCIGTWHVHIMALLTWVQTAGETVRTARSARGNTGTRAGPNGGADVLCLRIDHRVGPLHRETAWLGVGLRAD